MLLLIIVLQVASRINRWDFFLVMLLLSTFFLSDPKPFAGSSNMDSLGNDSIALV